MCNVTTIDQLCYVAHIIRHEDLVQYTGHSFTMRIFEKPYQLNAKCLPDPEKSCDPLVYPTIYYVIRSVVEVHNMISILSTA